MTPPVNQRCSSPSADIADTEVLSYIEYLKGKGDEKCWVDAGQTKIMCYFGTTAVRGLSVHPHYGTGATCRQVSQALSSIWEECKALGDRLETKLYLYPLTHCQEVAPCPGVIKICCWNMGNFESYDIYGQKVWRTIENKDTSSSIRVALLKSSFKLIKMVMVAETLFSVLKGLSSSSLLYNHCTNATITATFQLIACST